jgi:hypothetical protein
VCGGGAGGRGDGARGKGGAGAGRGKEGRGGPHPLSLTPTHPHPHPLPLPQELAESVAPRLRQTAQQPAAAEMANTVASALGRRFAARVIKFAFGLQQVGLAAIVEAYTETPPHPCWGARRKTLEPASGARA